MISFVIAARNESESLAELVREIDQVCRWSDYAYEIILIDDGSTDATWAQMTRLTKGRNDIKSICLRRNYGKGPALCAGFRAAQGEIVFTLDADLQDDPNDVPAFISALEQGQDVVVGWRETRRDPWMKRALSKVFNFTVGSAGLTLHDHNCGFKAFRAEAIKDMFLYGDMHRYMPILAFLNGFRVGEVRVNHRPRIHGKSNYGLSRTYRGFFDLLTILFLKSFRHRPMHLLGPLGFLFLTGGLLGMGYLAVHWAFFGPLGNRPLLTYSTAGLIFGSQLLATGFVAELLTAYMARFESLYKIREEIGVIPPSQKGRLELPTDSVIRTEQTPSVPLNN